MRSAAHLPPSACEPPHGGQFDGPKARTGERLLERFPAEADFSAEQIPQPQPLLFQGTTQRCERLGQRRRWC